MEKTDTLRCFACSCDLPDNSPKDHPTDRFYCNSCFEWTVEVQLSHASKEINWSRLADSPANTQQGSPFEISEVLEAEGWHLLEDWKDAHFAYLEDEDVTLENYE